MLKVIRAMPIPVLLAQEDSYQVASQRPRSQRENSARRCGKISLIRDIVAKNVNVKKIRRDRC
mgnify:CR=1 FL=1